MSSKLTLKNPTNLNGLGNSINLLSLKRNKFFFAATYNSFKLVKSQKYLVGVP